LEQGETFTQPHYQQQQDHVSPLANSFCDDDHRQHAHLADSHSIASNFHATSSGPGSLNTHSFLTGTSNVPLSSSGSQLQSLLPGSLPAIEYDQAVKAAAAYDVFASAMAARNGYNSAAQPSTSAGSFESQKKHRRPSQHGHLPDISGPGLVAKSEENFHPQHGYFPRFRRTSFDHTVGVPVEHGKVMPPPPKAAKVSRSLGL
jgi:hypothetical protein